MTNRSSMRVLLWLLPAMVLMAVLSTRGDGSRTMEDHPPSTSFLRSSDVAALSTGEAERFELPRQLATTTTTTTTTTAPPPPPTTTTTAPPSPPTTEVPPPDPDPSYADPSNPATWDRLAQCESGGDWHINTGNGYYGGIQFALSSWRGVGGTGYPHEHSRETQIEMGQRLWQQGGWNHWPACSSKLGYR